MVDITVYEKSDYVGGRTTCKIQVDDQVIQIAARGFHASNKNLVDAVRSLRLAPVMLDGKIDTDLTGRSGNRWGVYVSCSFFLFWLASGRGVGGYAVTNFVLQLFCRQI